MRLPCQRGERTQREKDEEGKARKASRRLFAIVVCYRFSPLHFSHFCLPHQVAFLSRASVLVCVCVCLRLCVCVWGNNTRPVACKTQIKRQIAIGNYTGSRKGQTIARSCCSIFLEFCFRINTSITSRMSVCVRLEDYRVAVVVCEVFLRFPCCVVCICCFHTIGCCFKTL